MMQNKFQAIREYLIEEIEKIKFDISDKEDAINVLEIEINALKMKKTKLKYYKKVISAEKDRLDFSKN